MVHLREWRQILFNFIREIRDQNNRGIVVEFSRVGLIDVADVYLYSGNVLFARHTTTASRIRVSGSYNQPSYNLYFVSQVEWAHSAPTS